MFAVWPPCNGADGISDIEGKVARVATSKLGNERNEVSSGGARRASDTRQIQQIVSDATRG